MLIKIINYSYKNDLWYKNKVINQNITSRHISYYLWNQILSILTAKQQTLK